MERDERRREGRGGERKGREEGAGSATKLKFGPQNYFPGAGAGSFLFTMPAVWRKSKKNNGK